MTIDENVETGNSSKFDDEQVNSCQTDGQSNANIESVTSSQNNVSTDGRDDYQFDPMFGSVYRYILVENVRHYTDVDINIRDESIRKLKNMKKTIEFDSVFVGTLMAMIHIAPNESDTKKIKFVEDIFLQRANNDVKRWNKVQKRFQKN